MTLQSYTDSLPKDKQYKLAIDLAKKTLHIWDNYADKNELTYRDTVVGMTHSVNRTLLKDTVDTIEEYLNLNKFRKLLDGKNKLLEISEQFEDPIVALQDTDWELPDDVRKTFYAVYNLLETIIGKEQTVFGDRTIYVSINQFIDALETSKTLTTEEISNILDKTKNG